jgi:hypothetical protein
MLTDAQCVSLRVRIYEFKRSLATQVKFESDFTYAVISLKLEKFIDSEIFIGMVCGVGGVVV